MFVDVSPGWGVLQSGITALAGFSGVCVGGWFTARNQKAERKHMRIVEQLQQFYSPMVGMRQELFAKRKASMEVHKVAKDALLAAGRDKGTDSSIRPLMDYDYKQWWNELVPLYEKMFIHFTDHMWLAEDSTRSHYAELTYFLEKWKRHNALALGADVSFELDLSDAKLQPFYDDLQANFERLRNESKN